MHTEVRRRTFLGAVAAGVPLLAHVSAQRHPQTHPTDPVQQQITQELARICRRLQTRGPDGEGARAVAAQLRTLSIYRAATGRDRTFTDSVRHEVRRRGRDVVLHTEVDLNRVREELKPFDIDTSALLLSQPTPPHRSRAFDALLRAGVSPQLVRQADVMEQMARDIDLRTGDRAAFRRVAYSLDCETLRDILVYIEVSMALSCAVPGLQELCVALAIDYAIIQLYVQWYC